MIMHVTLFCLLLVLSTKSNPIFPPNEDVYLDWNIRIELLDDKRNLFNKLFSDFNNLEIEILASFSAWSEGPLYVQSINSILFSSPTDRNLYRYNLDEKITTLFIEDAGIFGGIYDGDIPFDECLECGSNGLTTGFYGIENYVIMCQHALKRVIAFDPTNIDEDNIIIIADNLGGQELNSPNDITITRNAKSLYFTDPPFGQQQEGDTGFLDSFSRSKLGFSGVYRVDYTDISNGDTEPILAVDDMKSPNGLCVTNNGKNLIVANSGNEYGWQPYWNVYKIKVSNGYKGKTIEYRLKKTIDFNMRELTWNGFVIGGLLTDGMEVFDDDILLAVCPNGICLIDLKTFEIVGRITIDHLISNIYIHDGYIYVTGLDNLFRIKLN